MGSKHLLISHCLMAAMLLLVSCSPARPKAAASSKASPTPEPSPAAALIVPTADVTEGAAPAAWIDLYVSPEGDDYDTGTSREAPLRTMDEAWERVPENLTGSGYRINLLPGEYPCEPLPEDPENCINYFENRHGTAASPLVIQAADGPGGVTMSGGINLRDVDYLTVEGIRFAAGGPLPTNSSGNNLFHLEDGSHITLRSLRLTGPQCSSQDCNNLQEVLKVNQAQYLDVEDSEIGGAWHTAVDYFAVQYGSFRNNRLHTAGQWCMYVKGGSAYLQIEGNELAGCNLGFQAGQSSNLAVMTPPWLHYEAYDIKFTNNLLHDIPGTGLSVQGAYNVLLAHNTLYRVAYDEGNGFPLMRFVHGERSCTPIDEIPNVMRNCAAYASDGGWGPRTESDPVAVIPNRSIYVLNNLFYNPAPARTLYSHFEFPGPATPPTGFSGPRPALADEDLVIRGNVIWNGTPDHPFGNEDSEAMDGGCQPTHPTCSLAALQAQNAVNLFEPQLVNPAGGDYHPAADGNLFSLAIYPFIQPLADFGSWAALEPAVPAGRLSNTVTTDRDGRLRGPGVAPGAYAGTEIPVEALENRLYLPMIIRQPGE